MKKTPKTIPKDINDFENEVNLYRLVSGGSCSGLLLLRKLADKIHQDNYLSPGTRLPSLLLCGKEGTRLHALALLNSLCIEDIRECDSRYFDSGINSKEIFENSYFDTCHLITNIEQLRPQQEAVIWRYIKLGWCSYQNFALKTKEIIHNNGMIILTTKDSSKVAPPILSAVDYKVGIEPYNQANLELLVHMMLRYSGIDYSNDEEVLKTIIEHACGELDIIINDLLKVCILLAQSEEGGKLSIKTVEKASKLI